jgi:hypothetical protein
MTLAHPGPTTVDRVSKDQNSCEHHEELRYTSPFQLIAFLLLGKSRRSDGVKK